MLLETPGNMMLQILHNMFQGVDDTIQHFSVKVVIIGTKKLADGKIAAIWQYNYPFGIDTNYVRIVGDTIKIFDNSY